MNIAVTEDPVSLENSYIIQFDSHSIKTELMRVINIILQEKSCTQTEIVGCGSTKSIVHKKLTYLWLFFASSS